jgi:hypothetical protein
MPEPDLLTIFLNPLNELGVRYAITGAVATTIYGEPRLTHDIDLVLELKSNDAERLTEAFPLEIFYCPPVEVIRLEVGRNQRGHFNLIHHETGFKADIYLSGNDKLHIWALNNRKVIDVYDEDYWFAPIEYVILRKLEYFREGGSDKHIHDIESMLELSNDQIDFDQLNNKIRDMKLEEQWMVLKSISVKKESDLMI